MGHRNSSLCLCAKSLFFIPTHLVHLILLIINNVFLYMITWNPTGAGNENRVSTNEIPLYKGPLDTASLPLVQYVRPWVIAHASRSGAWRWTPLIRLCLWPQMLFFWCVLHGAKTIFRVWMLCRA